MPSWAKWGLSLLVAIALIAVGWRVPFVLVTLHILVCFILVIVIMLQSGSAADLAGAFGGAGSQTAFGPRGAATFLSRATTWCAIVFMMTSLTLSVKRDAAARAARARSSSRRSSPARRPRNRQTAPFSSDPAIAAAAPARTARQPAAPSQQPAQNPLLRNSGFCYTSFRPRQNAVVAELADAPA